MPYIDIGDYRYTLMTSGYAAVTVLDKTKTSYQGMQSVVSYNGRVYEVSIANYCYNNCQNLTNAPTLSSKLTSMEACFRNCYSLTAAPTIPSTVTNMKECFSGCLSLENAPTLSNSNAIIDMSFCFYHCSSLITAPIIPNSVTNMESCFQGCVHLESAPTLSDSNVITNLTSCFEGCGRLVNPPNIPSSVESMSRCFYGCSLLKGYILVSNEFIIGDTRSYVDIFTGCVRENYIINAKYGTSSEEDVAEGWRAALSDAPDNIHYEADDKLPPYITATVQRTDSNGNYSATGNYAKVTITTSSSNDNVPPISVSSRFEPPEVTTTEVFVNNSTTAVSNYNNINLGTNYADQFNFRCKATDNYGDSSEVTITLSRILALLDFLGMPTSDYPGDEPGMGMAIGTLATRNGVEIAFPVSIGQELLPPSTGTGSSKKVNLDSYQLTLGKFNKQDNNNVVVIGNGTSNSSRSNALTIDQYGNIRMYLGSNTTDTSLLSAITALSWNSEVIESD